METKIYPGDCLGILKKIPCDSIDCVMTSPPYWALRDYGIKNQIGLEDNFEDYIKKLCDIFDEVKRVLKKSGTCWVNLGDTYYTKSGGAFLNDNLNSNKRINEIGINRANAIRGKGLLKDKNLTLIPFRFAIEMQNRGWIFRNVIIWHKPNCMPTSVKDRFTVDFEYLFFFVKNKKYYFEKQYEPIKKSSVIRSKYVRYKKGSKCEEGNYAIPPENPDEQIGLRFVNPKGRNKRCVWTITTKGFHGSHFAVYPEELCLTPIKAGCPIDGIVLDPFCGSGTTGIVCKKLDRNFIGVDINPKYCKIAESRISEFKKNNCILCGIPLKEDEDFCKTCLRVMKSKYPNKKKFKQILQWHKNHTQLNQEC